MGFAFSSSSSKAKSSKEFWGMGLLLVFFPEDNSAIVDKNKLFSSSPSSSPNSSISATSAPVIRRSNSNRLLTKAQSTISICALLVFITLLLFTLSTFEPNNRTHQPRRFLTQNPENLSKHKPRTGAASSRDSLFSSSPWFGKMWKQKPKLGSKNTRFPAALQGLGTLYRRGTRAMADLAVGHVPDDLKDGELRLFLRALHRSGLTARADVVFLFGSNSSKFDSVIREENESFFKLVHGYKHLNKTSRRPTSSFDVTQFKAGKKETGEPLWGKKSRSGNSSNNSNNNSDSGESTQLSYGSVLGFEASELDPENSLAGFLDHVPLSMRRWACYPMLLGRVRRHFKHIMLVDVNSLVVLSDTLGLVRNRSPESVFLFTKPDSSKHGKKNSDKTQSHSSVTSAVVAGGARGIRRLSNAMLMEIVRAATTTQQHKKKNSLTESAILNQLVGNEFLLNNVKVIKSVDSVPDPSSFAQLGHNSGGTHSVVHRGNTNNDRELINSIITKQICSSQLDSSVYSDC
ncbi:uncharacterized protein LOC133831455 [Humulus lupulus]|uniref:uncharacterized protein LOC133831455 n=1 Tax=Humulus lupulus TaxID=3486 RepID=UPI002B401641|nr:uncharacterized protein LOC133831455 [Humulus lupulus]